ncbi:MAG TPA: hypothetical protein VJB63_02985 [Patescibacteria group bacterium]|nr:hypothetical protein [Patescibacteria group bacterium]
MESIGASGKSTHSSQSNSKAFIDPSYLKKNISLPQKHFSFLTFFLCIILIASVWIFFVSVDVMPNPFSTFETTNIPMIKPKYKKATVQLQKEYQNPFDKKTQYVNPFSSYKNPFDTLNAK